MKRLIKTYKKQCPYCHSTDVHYLGYSRKDAQALLSVKNNDEEIHDFQCGFCKRIFYYCGSQD